MEDGDRIIAEPQVPLLHIHLQKLATVFARQIALNPRRTGRVARVRVFAALRDKLCGAGGRYMIAVVNRHALQGMESLKEHHRDSHQ